MEKGYERFIIWRGMLEWTEKTNNPSNPTRFIKRVHCLVSTNSKDGKPELKAHSWPAKLKVGLIPKELTRSFGGVYLKNSKCVLFHIPNCEAFKTFEKALHSGFAGCVHLSGSPAGCDILILHSTAEENTYLGFLPNDQVAFSGRLRKVFQARISPQMLKQEQGGPRINPQPGEKLTTMGGPSQLPSNNPPASQTAPQQGLIMSQTNTMPMGDGQVTHCVVTSSSPSGSDVSGLLGQSEPTAK